MHHAELPIALIIIAGIILISKFLQEKVKIPLPYSFIALAYAAYHMLPHMLPESFKTDFDENILFMIPLIFMGDILHLKWHDLYKYKYSILYLSVVSVAFSIAIGASLYYFNILNGLTIGMYVALFSIVMATDAISVQGVLSQFKGIPHNVKILFEGESLGNDATAMIAFYFVGIPWILQGSFDFSTLSMIFMQVFVGSIALGLAVGYVGYQMLKMFEDSRSETLIIIITSYIAFLGAEHFHFAGIASILAAIILLKALSDKDIEKIKLNSAEKLHDADVKTTKRDLISFVKKTATTKERMESVQHIVSEYGYFASVLIFISLAELINFEKLLTYWKEIVIVFIATTIIRGASMAKFWIIGKNTKHIDHIDFSGWFILTMAGMKGALSIIMVHALPKEFMYKDMFESIVIGVILMSIFIYGLALIIFFNVKASQEAKNAKIAQ